MYEGKRGTGGVVIHEAASAPRETPWLVMQGELRRAIANDELSPTMVSQ